MSATPHKLFERRKNRVRRKIKTSGHVRLSVYRSKQHIYAQIIDDEKQVTLVSASTNDKELSGKLKKSTSNIAAAKEVGALIAKRAQAAQIATVVFDRGGYLYHGRVKALGDAARESGLKF